MEASRRQPGMLEGLSRFLIQHERCGAGFDVAHPAGLGSGRVSITCRGCGARHEYATATIEFERELKIETTPPPRRPPPPPRRPPSAIPPPAPPPIRIRCSPRLLRFLRRATGGGRARTHPGRSQQCRRRQARANPGSVSQPRPRRERQPPPGPPSEGCRPRPARAPAPLVVGRPGITVANRRPAAVRAWQRFWASPRATTTLFVIAAVALGFGVVRPVNGGGSSNNTTARRHRTSQPPRPSPPRRLRCRPSPTRRSQRRRSHRAPLPPIPRRRPFAPATSRSRPRAAGPRAPPPAACCFGPAMAGASTSRSTSSAHPASARARCQARRRPSLHNAIPGASVFRRKVRVRRAGRPMS